LQVLVVLVVLVLMLAFCMRLEVMTWPFAPEF
jgi:hypothetical protein